METVFFGQCYFAASRNHYWNKEKTVLREKLILASGKLIFQLVQTIFSLHFTEFPVSFFPSRGKVLFKEIVIFGFWKRILDLIVTSTSRKKAVNKIILFPIERNSDYQNEGVVNSSKRYVSTTWKSCFHRQEYLKKLRGEQTASNEGICEILE